ncbi:hypothetical protein D9M72_500560 [compost metagenome]
MRHVETLPDRMHGVDGEVRVLLDEDVPKLRRPSENQALGRGCRRSRIVAALQRTGKAEEVAGIDDPDDDLLPVLGDLGHLQPAVQQQEEEVGLRTLLEHGFVLRNTPHRGARQQRIQFLIAHFLEKRERFDECAIECSHFGILPFELLCSSTARNPAKGPRRRTSCQMCKGRHSTAIATCFCP